MNYQDLRKKLISKAVKDHLPILGEFELTAHCNFSCEMCYVVDGRSKDLTTLEWKKIFKKAHENGLFFAVLTGGEIFMRKDFTELYNFLYDLGVKITLFTNASLINIELIEVLKKRPPEYIAITLYGSNDETYFKIAKVKNGFTDVAEVITLLRSNGINLVLRTIPLKPILVDLDYIINYVKSLGMKLSYTQYLGPTRNQKFNHQSLRLDALELKEFTDKINNEFGYESNSTENFSVDEKSCAALRAAYFINYEGLMMPCAMAYKPARTVLSEEPFIEVIHHLYNEMKQLESGYECLTCKYKNSCIQCYARRLLEKDPKSCNSYLRNYALVKAGDHE